MKVLSISAWQCLIDEADGFETDVSSARTSAVQSALARAGFSATPEESSRAYEVAADLFEERYLTGDPINNFERAAKIFSVFNLEPGDSAIGALVRDLENTHMNNGLQLTPGAKTFLSAVAPIFNIALLSDTWMTPGRAINELLEKSGVAHHFRWKFFSDQTNAHKINGSAFLHMANEIGVETSEITHIADHWLSDAHGASLANVGKVLLLESNNHPVPDTPRLEQGDFPSLMRFDQLSNIASYLLRL